MGVALLKPACTLYVCSAEKTGARDKERKKNTQYDGVSYREVAAIMEATCMCAATSGSEKTLVGGSLAAGNADLAAGV